MALVAANQLSERDVETLWRPRYVAASALSEDERVAQRQVWRNVVERAAATIPELSSISF